MYAADSIVQPSTNGFPSSKSRSFDLLLRMNAVVYLSICNQLQPSYLSQIPETGFIMYPLGDTSATYRKHVSPSLQLSKPIQSRLRRGCH